jgi:NAD(P)-dependent dehydrogenase (short-subunit alcohol dehydrogenase family)
VITGGTDGIGRALADDYLRRGFEVVVIGTNAGKGRAFLESAADGRAHFMPADLSRVGENRRIADHLAERLPASARWDTPAGSTTCWASASSTSTRTPGSGTC